MAPPFGTETVLDVRHWTDSYFSFTLTRDDGFRFDNGQFVMIGLEVDGKPLLRAYSIASPNWDEQLEFFSIKVQNGPLTSRLQHIQPGDAVLVGLVHWWRLSVSSTAELAPDQVQRRDRVELGAAGQPPPWQPFETELAHDV